MKLRGRDYLPGDGTYLMDIVVQLSLQNGVDLVYLLSEVNEALPC